MKRHGFDSWLCHWLVRELSSRTRTSLKALHWPNTGNNYLPGRVIWWKPNEIIQPLYKHPLRAYHVSGPVEALGVQYHCCCAIVGLCWLQRKGPSLSVLLFLSLTLHVSVCLHGCEMERALQMQVIHLGWLYIMAQEGYHFSGTSYLSPHWELFLLWSK